MPNLLKFPTLLSLLLAASLAVGCRGSRPHLLSVAWNEDTVHTYQFELLNDGSFVYSIPDKSTEDKMAQYRGKLGCLFGRDTVYLNYVKDKAPPGLTNYLIIEVSGRYIIQAFTDGRKRVFMRRKLEMPHCAFY